MRRYYFTALICHGTFSCTVRYTGSRKRLFAKVYVIPKGNAYIGELILGSGFKYPNSRGHCTANGKKQKRRDESIYFSPKYMPN